MQINCRQVGHLNLFCEKHLKYKYSTEQSVIVFISLNFPIKIID